MKKLLSIVSLAVGIIGLGVFFKPILEIVCGIGGLILAKMAKDEKAGMITDGIRHWGEYIAWINIIWVCIEFALKFVGIDLF